MKIETTYCSQYAHGGGMLILAGSPQPGVKIEIVIRCVKEYYQWKVHHSLSQTEGPPARKGTFNEAEEYRYLPEASVRAANLAMKYLLVEDEDEHEHGPGCNHNHVAAV